MPRDLAYWSAQPVPSPLADHPLTPLIDAYMRATSDRVMFCSDANIAAEQNSIDALNKALKETK